jgi:hypothetical protein
MTSSVMRCCLLTAAAILAPASLAVGADAPTFNRDVAPILYRNCVTCHRPDNIAPFSLLTYESAAARARTIASATRRRYMPPWKPEPGHGDFEGVRRLTGREIDTIQSWADAGAPEGDPSARPVPPSVADRWQLGTPDLIVKMQEPFKVPVHGHDVYQCFVVPLNLPEDKVISAIEFRPGNRKMLHHSILFMDTRGVGRWRDGGDEDPGYKCFGGPGFTAIGLGGWVPGATPIRLPDGVGRVLRKGSDLVIQNHYHPQGSDNIDQSSIALYFSKVPVQKTVFGFPVGKPDLVIPAGESRYRVASSFVTPIDVDVIGITPHMHLLGSEVRVWATLPDGSVKRMIWIKRWDFNWQGEYRYKRVQHLPKNTRIDVETFYDNSANNPRNPTERPRVVRWGESTTDEMNVVFFQCQTTNRLDEWTVLSEVVFQQPAWLGLVGRS